MISMLRLVDRIAVEHKRVWRRAVASSVAGAVIQAIAYLSLFLLIPAVLEQSDDIGWLLMGLVVLLILESIVRLYELSFGYKHAADVISNLRLRLGAKLRTVPAEELSRRQSGDLSTVLAGNARDAALLAGDLGVTFVRLVIIPVALAIGLAFVDWRLLAAVLFGLVVALLGLYRFRSKMSGSVEEMHAADARSASRIVEYVQGLPVFKASGQVGAHADRLVEALEDQGEVLNRTQTSVTAPLALGSSGAHLIVVGLIAMAAALAIDGSMSVATAAAVAVVAVRLGEPLVLAGALTGVIEVTQSALRRIDEVLEIPPLPQPASPSEIEGSEVVFDGVTFSYRDQTVPAIRDMSFTLNEGSLTALVGPSGSGKSTIARTLMRYADPIEGEVRIGGTDIRDVTQSELMKHISAVFQEVYLFDDTILENVRLARPSASDDEVAAVLHAANCESLLERMPQGMHTRVGEVGGMLSGGERQRVAIARALLKDAPIVILDEPTSALDSDSEVAVQDAIDELVRHKTVLVIAHRLSTVARADQILVLEDGRIIQQGRHEELLSADGRYAAMWKAQTAAKRWKITA